MFAVICSPQYSDVISKVVDIIDDQIIFKQIKKNIDVNEELGKVTRLAIKHLIIDTSAINEPEKLPNYLMQYKLMNEETQIIIIAPKYIPGNKLMNNLVTKVHVYDIIAPEDKDETDIISQITECIKKPYSYKKGVKWIIEQKESTIQYEQVQNTIEKEKVVNKTIIKEKIVGTVTISIAGAMNRIGTTHIAISISTYLSSLGNKVAIVELNNSNHFEDIKNSYKDIQIDNNSFVLNNIKYYTNKYNDFLSVFDEKYNYIIYDMGLYNNCNIEEFKRSGMRIIVSGVKDWEVRELEKILAESNGIHNNKYLFNFSDETTFEFIKSNMGQLQCYLAPYNPNPYEIDFTDNNYYQLLKEILPNTISKSKNKVLKFLKKR